MPKTKTPKAKAPKKVVAKAAPVKAAKKAPKKAAAKAAAKNGNGPTKERGPSKISLAVEFMRAELKKNGGEKALEYGDLKALFAKAADKFGLSPATTSTQYGKQIRNK